MSEREKCRQYFSLASFRLCPSKGLSRVVEKKTTILVIVYNMCAIIYTTLSSTSAIQPEMICAAVQGRQEKKSDNVSLTDFRLRKTGRPIRAILFET